MSTVVHRVACVVLYCIVLCYVVLAKGLIHDHEHSIYAILTSTLVSLLL